MIAGVLAFVAKCLSKQFSVIFSLPPINQRAKKSLKSHSKTFSQGFFHVKFWAISAQKPSGSSTLFL